MEENQGKSIKNAALLVATIVSFLGPFMGSSANIALPTIGKDLELDAIVLSWVATSYIFASAIFLIPFGRIADIVGRKKIFLYGVIAFTVSSLGCALARTAEILIVFRALQGFGTSMIFGTGVAILTSVFPPGERGRALGINVAAVYLGLSLGPFMGGFLTEHLGWRSIFFMNVPLGIIIISVTLLKLKGEWAEAKGEGFDIWGSILYSITFISLMYGLSILPSEIGFFLIGFGIIGLVIFFIVESKIKSPVLNLNLFKKNTVFTFSSLAALINYGATYAVGFLLSLYLQYLHNFTPVMAGLILVCQPIIMSVFSPIAGKVSDKIEPRIVASAGMFLTSIGLFMLIFIDKDFSLPLIISSLVILGFGFAFFSSPNTNAIMSSVDRKYYGVASAMVGTMRTSGMMISMAIAILLFSLFIGKSQITPEYYHLFLKSAKIAFMIFSILCFGGIFASLARGKLRKNNIASNNI